ncbi:MAG: rod shape-determining protein MreC [Gammaproteobacteria bacterium]|nr:rod shape-determining protein MreC [Gammaproteobacteria bacterium]
MVSPVTPLYRLLLLAVLSLALMLVDYNSRLLVGARAVGSVLNLPFHGLISLPGASRDWWAGRESGEALYEKYSALLAKQAVLEARLQRFDALQAENRRLSELLAAPRRPGERVQFAEIVDLGLAPFTHRVGLNRGVEAGVHLGQAVILPEGVLGQVSAAGVGRSVVTLLTDPGHAIPVQIQRNGRRAIARGLGVLGRLELPFLSAQTDIKNGDVLVTSGLGGNFPPGYKVARVSEIVTDNTAEFLAVRATPFADIRSAEHVLLLAVDAPATVESTAPATKSPPAVPANSAAAAAESAESAAPTKTPVPTKTPAQ